MAYKRTPLLGRMERAGIDYGLPAPLILLLSFLPQLLPLSFLILLSLLLYLSLMNKMEQFYSTRSISIWKCSNASSISICFYLFRSVSIYPSPVYIGEASPCYLTRCRQCLATYLFVFPLFDGVHPLFELSSCIINNFLSSTL